ncbi:hypothetical protein A2954_01895 [Candidatus Roizmanbacteria bacterium RIFCSPLOWO2_01_FULL_37_12]|uniref:Hydrogenase maturation protease n=1 Tax=Candidatus Roizmanbacteria bacterium RIFCSPLOWO2_01_FULL_37_12 TaxID=1802056 RepID=A0A1F7I9K5_9BACT|nr:MAG: hypothetical protein A2768_01380 [Candidatus Roizmanbacteria bacterium RIFCSPHIGHO2_01_FULL_37_16]OGK23272.1 MAG: hypothetical protein A3D76_00615 [Candidatus Roizmanbacteria bacterium RIFCSPHIGHO2_02_FULL_37_9b]OGK40044.1 MAG: hypothetical protein A2954_01895 [Candidatus Roizmanbacteria bacterium RIFCSPLOWO2_01_FULL_37_12]
MINIYVFGNPYLKEDSAPIKILQDLRRALPDVKFIITDPNENFPPEGVKDLIILDTVKGIKMPKILGLNDLQEIQKSPNSPHDYDLGLHLLLLKKLKKIETVRIFGIPTKIRENRVIKWIKETLKT